MKQKVLVVDDDDNHMFQLITMVPLVDKKVSILCCVFNFFLPGFGTLFAACSANETVSKTQMMMALL